MKGHIMIFAHILAFLWPPASTIDANCNYNQQMAVGQTYYIYQPEYPANYKGAHSCQWLATSPKNTQIQLYCENIIIPQSPGCEMDRLVVSTSGDKKLQDGHYYCGTGQLSINSDKNIMNIGFFSSPSTSGGTFVCTIQAFKIAEPNCDCGWHNTRRIVGGENTLINEYPMMSALIDYDAQDTFCGSTIISNFYAVTAGHCLEKRMNLISRTGLLVGDWNLTSGLDTPAARLYPLEKFIIHENYVARNYLNDIALVKTINPIVYSLEVGPACLPLNYLTANFEGQMVTALGWGSTGFGDGPSSTLQKVNLDWISFQSCKQAYPAVTENQFCTYARGKDSCQGDSGGPNLWQSVPTSRLQLLGIISYGAGCAMDLSPGTNTRVSQYVGWITKQTPEVSYCAKY